MSNPILSPPSSVPQVSAYLRNGDHLSIYKLRKPEDSFHASHTPHQSLSTLQSQMHRVSNLLFASTVYAFHAEFGTMGLRDV